MQVERLALRASGVEQKLEATMRHLVVAERRVGWDEPPEELGSQVVISELF